ncbi:MAG: EAL domain-containing protein [Rhodospirillales bacterium]|jgi:diguanylate cyclase (GGDEF)-like protein/PAS domain S-box-containing protein|nr:EAL domain-containing protein [Rhodospirillales bacterium]
MNWFERIDLFVYDWMLARNGRPASGEVVIVTIDERSLNALGPWAWRRSVHAEAVRRLDQAGARAIAFDVVFAGPDAHDPAGDALLAGAMREHAGVVLPILHERLSPSGQLVEVLPAPPLAEAAAALAHVEVEEDLDGVVRRSFLKGGVATPHWPALALAAVQLVKPEVLSGLPVVRRAETEPQVLPMAWVRDEMILIPYAGPGGRFPRVSYIDVLNGSFPEGVFKDRIVLVGAAATALGDMLMVPFDRQHRMMSGVELQANIADALLQGIVLRPAPDAWSVAFAAAATVLHALLYELTGALWLAFAGAAGLVAFVALWATAAFGLWLGPSAAGAGLAFGLAVQASLRLRSGRAVLLWQSQRADAGLRSIADGVIATDASRTIVFMNPAAEQMTGFLFSEAGGRPLRSILQLQDALAGQAVDLDRVIKDGFAAENSTVEAVLRTRQGDCRTVRGTIARVGGDGGSEGGLVLALNDVTDVHNLARSIQYQATHDPLTALPNRKLFEQGVEHALAAARGKGRYAAVMLVEFGCLAAIRGELGQHAGNAVLRMAAARLAAAVGKPGMTARIGEHTFALLFLDLVHGDSATFLAQRIRKTLAEPFDIAGFEQCVSVSIGTATYPRHAGDARLLLFAAEQALAAAKQQGVGRIQHAIEAPRPPASRRQAIRRDLRQAIERDEMELHFQPQMGLAGGVTGVEALLRWWGPDGRLNPPEEVVAAAEELGLADELSAWVLRTACREAGAAATAAGLDSLRLSVNLTANQFLDPRLPALIRSVLTRPQARAVSLVLEITEETLIADVDEAKHVIHQIRDIGVDVFIDDFGVGYASLVYLKKLPLTGLKIDKSYVHDAIMEANGAAIVRAIIALAHSMRIKVVAEGVESREQLDFLCGESCDEAQGYLISRPLPTQRLVSWLQARTGTSKSLTG